MLKEVKTPRYFKSFFIGMSAISLPTFFYNGTIKKVDLGNLKDIQKLQRDYVNSTREIRKVAETFGYKNT